MDLFDISIVCIDIDDYMVFCLVVFGFFVELKFDIVMIDGYF